MGVLSGKVAFVTGGGRGIGAATVRLLAEAGASVMAVSRTESELRAVCESLQKRELRCEYSIVDVTKEDEVERAFSKTKSTFGAVSILVNNAGVIRAVPFMKLETSTWDEILNVNLRGAFLCSRAAFRQMQETGGVIINISSLSGIRGTDKFPGFSAYTVSKHGIIGLTEALAVEGKSVGIRVNCVAPGVVDTRMLKEVAPDLKTNTTPEQIAEVILFLADESRSRSLNGAVIETFNNFA